MRVVVATVQVPFVRGGAEALAESLLAALRAGGHEAELVALPFQWSPPERIPDHVLACRLLALGDSNGVPVDRVIGLKFPACHVRHPRKVLWLLHQHRAAYDLWESPVADLPRFAEGGAVRDAVRAIDARLLPEARAVYTISENVSARLRAHCGVESRPLYHPPPGADGLRPGEARDYVLFPSRLVATKRQDLALRALARTRAPVRLVLVGAADAPGYGEELRALALQLGVAERVEWRERVPREELHALYAHARAVLFPPLDEDYGYVTLEAMLAARPVVTCRDSGGPLEFVEDGRTGLVCDPDPDDLARALDALWAAPERARELGAAGLARYRALGIGWPQVVRSLLA